MDDALKKQLVSSFAKTIEPIRKTILFRLCLLLVTFLMVLLPLIYFGIVIGAGYGVYYYAVHYYKLLQPQQTGALSFFGLRFLLYVGPIVIGSILVVYMAIPLIPRFGKKDGYALCSISPSAAPDFCKLVELICNAVKAPYPKRIELTMEPNACAYFNRGFLSFFNRKDLVLSIGIPLIASLNVSQLSGIIAHEMGHFSQGTSMRFSYIIESVHVWFYRAVYGGNSFDENLVEFEQQPGGSIALIVVLSRLFIMLTKLVLWLIMMLSFLVSKFMSRQMEYDADMYQAQITGSRNFKSTFYALGLLNYSYTKSGYAAMLSWQDQILCDNLPKLIKHFAKSLIGEKSKDLINEMLLENTRLFDTHPSINDRISRVLRLNVKGTCHIKYPSRGLFRSFEDVSINLTKRFYQLSFRTKIHQNTLVPLDEYLEKIKRYEHELK